MIKLLILTILILVLAFGIWFLFFRQDTVKKSSKEGPVIFLGNSLTVGLGANDGEDFPSLVSMELNLSNYINAGVSGDTSEDALNRLQTDVLSKNPSVVVVLLGGNDFLQKIPEEKTIKNLDEIVRRISESGSAVVLVHLKANPLKEQYKEPVKEIAKKYEAALVLNILNGIFGNADLMSDQIHPNAKGYELMADRISPALKKVLDK